MLNELVGLFFLGIATFLSPCSIALISVYLTYSAGVSKSIRRGFIIGCSFMAAMCLTFFVLGFAISSLIPISIINSRIFFGIAGILILLFGLSNLGFFKKIGLVSDLGGSLTEQVNQARLTMLTRFSTYNFVIGSFLFGLAVSIAVGPCTLSLVLPAILLTLLTTPTPFHAGLLLFMFGLGHALPVIVLSVALATARKAATDKITGAGEWLTKIFGLAFLVIGIVIVVYALGGW